MPHRKTRPPILGLDHKSARKRAKKSEHPGDETAAFDPQERRRNDILSLKKSAQPCDRVRDQAYAPLLSTQRVKR